MNAPMQGIPREQKAWVLIVEDDPDILGMIKEELLNAGLKVLTCSTSSDAYRMLANQKFNCIVLDMHLERGAGDQIVSFVKQDAHGFNFNTPIVVVSGELNVDVVKKIKASVNEFFVKPFDLNKVVARIKALSGVS